MSQSLDQLENAPINRRLARLTTIGSIRRHPNADTLEIATVDGWQVVFKEGQYVAGDPVVFIEIDSICPPTESFDFLKTKNYRVKTVKLRGELSQGLCMPPMILATDPEIPNFIWDVDHAEYAVREVQEGPIESQPHITSYIVLPNSDNTDLTEALGITKYAPPLAEGLAGKALGRFPSFISKTDQERVQNMPREVAASFEANETYEATLKLDGTSFTAYYNNGKSGICSRNLELDPEDQGNVLWRLANSTNLLKALNQIQANIAIQCEAMGPGIQGNRETLEEPRLFMFDVYAIDEGRYLSPGQRMVVFRNLGLLDVVIYHAPILVANGPLPGGTVDELLAFADRKSYRNPVCEGVVFKRSDGKFSFKVINTNFLLAEK